MKTYRLGRSEECDVVLNYPTVSRVHAELVVTKDKSYFLTDRQSSGGTFVAGIQDWEEISQAFVEASDTILLGRQQIEMSAIITSIHNGTTTEGIVEIKDVDLPSGKVKRDPETGEPVRVG